MKQAMPSTISSCLTSTYSSLSKSSFSPSHRSLSLTTSQELHSSATKGCSTKKKAISYYFTIQKEKEILFIQLFMQLKEKHTYHVSMNNLQHIPALFWGTGTWVIFSRKSRHSTLGFRRSHNCIGNHKSTFYFKFHIRENHA